MLPVPWLGSSPGRGLVQEEDAGRGLASSMPMLERLRWPPLSYADP